MANRLHDFGRSGAWALLPAGLYAGLFGVASIYDSYNFQFLIAIIGVFLLPLLCVAFAAALAIFSSAPDANRFGPPGGAVLAAAAPAAPETLLVNSTTPARIHATVKVIDALLRPTLRLNQSGYWAAWLIMCVASFVISLVLNLLLLPSVGPLARALFPELGIWPILALTTAPSIWIGFCVYANRLHDLNYRAAWLIAPAAIYLTACVVVSLGDAPAMLQLAAKGQMLLFVSYSGLGLVLGFIKGKNEPNRFGPPMALALR